MSQLIEVVCRAHLEHDEIGPAITLIDGRWAYCAGRSTTRHEWIRIPATRREDLGHLPYPIEPLLQEREAS